LTQDEALRNLFKEKGLYKKDLSRLTFKKKIEILIQLQKIAKGMKKPGEKKDRIVWLI
jgi:hypothetical protein